MIYIFKYMTPCRLLGSHQYFSGIRDLCCKGAATGLCETSVNNNQMASYDKYFSLEKKCFESSRTCKQGTF